MLLQHLTSAFAISCLGTITTAFLSPESDRYPMGGAVIFPRQDTTTDCPSYTDCTCEPWGMSCDLSTYDWYECNDTSIAGSYDCNAPTGTATATVSLTRGHSSLKPSVSASSGTPPPVSQLSDSQPIVSQHSIAHTSVPSPSTTTVVLPTTTADIEPPTKCPPGDNRCLDPN